MPIVTGMAPAPVVSDLGWTVELERAEAHLRDLQFTTRGEAHASYFPAWLVGTAHAHPGHLAGGDVVGELSGSHRVDFMHEETELGTAVLIETKYDGMNFVFDLADSRATVNLAGTASRDGVVVEWSAEVAQDEGRAVTVVVFDRDIDASPPPIAFGLATQSPTWRTLFDGIEFVAGDWPAESDGSTRLRRALQSHDFWWAE